MLLRLLRRLFAALMLMLLMAAIAVWLYVLQATPIADGVVNVAGIRATVRIDRDANGIPTIRAESVEDTVFGLGYVHAQDRLWQLETHKRIGAGRLSEAFGEGALETDRFLRALGVRRAAAAQWARASAETRATLMAYTAGINAVIADGVRARPPEFILLGLPLQRWTPEDTLAWAIMMAWDLGGNWSTELARMRFALTMPVRRVNEVIPPYPGDQPLVTHDYAALYRELKVDARLGQHALHVAPPSGVEGVGSNNWVVSGRLSDSGKPLLANDPHLKLSAPALWYFARLQAPGLKVAGATIPGLPFVILGQNERIAWGFTNTGPDVQDLYLERIDPGDANRYQTPDGWAAFETREEIIHVKDRPPVKLVVRATRHGPVISDASAATEGLTGPVTKPAYAIAMRWTALDVDGASTDAAAAFMRARSVSEFIAAAGHHVAPMQNMVVADVEGRIGAVSAGRVPLRRPENELKGQVPSPGWQARFDWAGFLDATQTPREIDPERGFIATANQRIHPVEYPHYLTNEWALPYRQQRIEGLLRATAKHQVASMRAIQADMTSGAALKLVPMLRRAKSTHALAAPAQARLEKFDGTMPSDKAAPLILWAWTRQLTRAIVADEIGEKTYDVMVGTRSFRDALESVLERDDAWWCDDKTTPDQAETCAQQIDAAFTRALEELAAKQGDDVAAWRWGYAHMARSEHRPFSHVKALSGWFELRTPTGGDTYTINVGRVGLRPDRTTGELYLNEHAASLRAIYDLADRANSRVMHSSGQSGLPFSAAYRNFVRPWAAVEDVPLWNADAVGTLVLEPGGSN